MKSLVSRFSSELRARKGTSDEVKARREYIAQEILAVLKDEHSLGYYRKIATSIPTQRIFEVLGLVREMVSEGGIKRSQGALFTSLIQGRIANAFGRVGVARSSEPSGDQHQ